jgi:rubrerythrin
MAEERRELSEMFCAALELKEKKKLLYEGAMKSCTDADSVGRETFRMLMDAEEEHSRRLQDVYEELKQGKDWEAACRYYPDQAEGVRVHFEKLAAEVAARPEACPDQVGAIDAGLEFEDASIRFFEKQLPRATEEGEREFIERMVVDEREHYRTLADLKYYYTDTEGWFMEKSRARLDGAGGVA